MHIRDIEHKSWHYNVHDAALIICTWWSLALYIDIINIELYLNIDFVLLFFFSVFSMQYLCFDYEQCMLNVEINLCSVLFCSIAYKLYNSLSTKLNDHSLTYNVTLIKQQFLGLKSLHVYSRLHTWSWKQCKSSFNKISFFLFTKITGESNVATTIFQDSASYIKSLIEISNFLPIYRVK